MLIRAVITYFALGFLAGATGAALGAGVIAPEAIANPARYTLISCKLPDATRKAGRAAFISIPGPVKRLSVIDCEDQGGMYYLSLCAERDYLGTNARGGDVEAMRLLAQALEAKWDPTCVPKPNEAMEWYEKAAAKGDRLAAMALSRLLVQGGGSIAQDPARARKWLDAALGTNSATLFSAEAKAALESIEQMRRRMLELEQQIQQLEQEREEMRRRGNAAAAEWEQKVQEARSKAASLSEEYERASGRIDPKALVSEDSSSGDLQIVMLDPPILAQRSAQPLVYPISGTEETRLEYNVIGRVITPRGSERSLRVKVNGKDVGQLDEGGFFHALIPLAVKSRNVSIEASAAGMKAATQQFRLEFAKGNLPPPVATAGPRVSRGKSIGLVIGISDYNEERVQKGSAARYWPNLANARRDAVALGEVLEKNYGFRVEYLLDADATHDRILGALIRLRQTLDEDDQLVVYYAGHGDIDKNSTRGFWIPVDAWQESTLGPKWIQSEQITNAVEAIKARQVLIISDSCYSAALNPAIAAVSPLASERTRPKVIAELARRPSRIVMTSGSFAPVPDRGMGNHSLFTGALVETLGVNSGTVLGQELFRRVESVVLRRARELNTPVSPQYGGIDSVGHLGGDFVFQRTG
jgi:Caspase domain